ncbi:hypothetical protein H4Q26_015243 [Puccinia striiformis f. sp. tritici PST-130]|nr:hypothetical protein H4Q26_015243 [Puccinia striiformis f. sp. tritici PST-130]
MKWTKKVSPGAFTSGAKVRAEEDALRQSRRDPFAAWITYPGASRSRTYSPRWIPPGGTSQELVRQHEKLFDEHAKKNLPADKHTGSASFKLSYSELSENSYPTDTPEMQQLRQQADLVIQGFDSLAGPGQETRAHFRDPTPNQSDFGANDSYRPQITPGPVPKPFHRSDQHFEDFKCFRLHGLDEFIRDSLKNGFESLRQKYRWVTEELISPTERYIHLERVDHNPLWWSITRTTVLLKGSELDIICGHWLHEGLEEMVYELEDVTRLADPRRIHNIDTSEGAMQGLSNAAIKLSKPFIPIGRNIDQAPSFTEMSSDQFNVLKCSATKIGESMSNLVHLLIEADIDDRPDTSRYLIKEIEKITPLFPSYVALLMLYIVPFFPDTNGLSPQIYFRDWFVSWNTSFSVATYNAIQAVHFFEQDEP